MITADQLVAHLIGDYVLQSDWMAQRKRTEFAPAMAHAVVYTLCFVPILFTTGVETGASGLSIFLQAWVICFSHFCIDRWGLARYVVWAKNWLAPRWMELGDRGGGLMRPVVFTRVRNLPWSMCATTGYPSDRPPFLAVWLLIIADNVLHILINGLALRYL